MSDENLRQLRVLHIVSSNEIAGSAQQFLFMPLLTRLPKQRVKAQVIALAAHAVPAAVLRQNGVPVHDIPLSRNRVTWATLTDLLSAARAFHPDVIQAWGHTAQIAATLMRARLEWKPKLMWSVAGTAPLPRNPGFIDRQKLKLTVKLAPKVDRIVYTSEAAGAYHRRVSYPDGGHAVITPGVDATRYKPDLAMRAKVREQLQLAPEAFVLGMMAPFQPEYDHPTFLRAVGELIKANPNIVVLLAGHGVQKGNGPLMALVGGGTLGTRTQLLGEWSDVASLFNACDVVCSSALTDAARMSLVTAMLCGVPCVATGMGAQGEVLGQFGVAIEPGSPQAFIRGVTRIMQLTPEKRAFMAHGARKHALQNYIYVRSLQKYLQLYYDLVGRQSLVTDDVPTPEIDASVPMPPAVTKEMIAAAAAERAKRHVASMAELADPDSLEGKVQESVQPVFIRPVAPVVPPPERKPAPEGDVLQNFERDIAQQGPSKVAPMAERARGVTEDVEELLSYETFHSLAPAPASQSTQVNAKPAAAAADEPMQLSLVSDQPVGVAAEPSATQQLELLADPMPEKRAANS